MNKSKQEKEFKVKDAVVFNYGILTMTCIFIYFYIIKAFSTSLEEASKLIATKGFDTIGLVLLIAYLILNGIILNKYGIKEFSKEFMLPFKKESVQAKLLIIFIFSILIATQVI